MYLGHLPGQGKSRANTHGRDDNVCLAGSLLDKIDIIEAAYDGLDAKVRPELFCLLGISKEGGDAERGPLGVFKQASEDGATDIA